MHLYYYITDVVLLCRGQVERSENLAATIYRELPHMMVGILAASFL